MESPAPASQHSLNLIPTLFGSRKFGEELDFCDRELRRSEDERRRDDAMTTTVTTAEKEDRDEEENFQVPFEISIHVFIPRVMPAMTNHILNQVV